MECASEAEVIVVPLNDIPFVDFPELRINEHESTEMPFRYVKNADGSPYMPEVSCRRFNFQERCTNFLTGIGNGGPDQS